MARQLIFSLGIVAALCGRQWAIADEPGAAPNPSRPNVESKTMGGKQFWGDELLFRGYRIQRLVTTSHCRLLDPENRRLAWGTFDDCQTALDRIKHQRKLEPMTGRAVLVLHGLGRTRSSMRSLAESLQENGNATVLRASYPSTRANLDQHAKALASILDHLEGVQQIDLVAHSLGNLVIRRYLAQAEECDAGGPDPRIRRIVMLTPPNQGSFRGLMWDQSAWFGGLYHIVVGEPGLEVASGWKTAAPRLATPACEFGIIAGGRGDGEGWHEQVPGDDDGTVAVCETLLPGARDFVVVPVRHTHFADDSQVQEFVSRFLNRGCFISEEARRPIAREEETTNRD